MISLGYARWDYKERQHHERYKRYVEKNGLVCQECGGRGGEYDYPAGIELGSMWMQCGWCEGTGKVTKWTRGYWLRLQKQCK